MSQTGSTGARTLGLAFSDEDLDADGPGDAEDDGEKVDGGYDDPASDTVVFMHRVPCIESSHKHHNGCHSKPTVDSTAATTPFVRPDEGWNGEDENDNGGDAGGQKRGTGR